jgi:hypothetical protein
MCLHAIKKRRHCTRIARVLVTGLSQLIGTVRVVSQVCKGMGKGLDVVGGHEDSKRRVGVLGDAAYAARNKGPTVGRSF